MQRLFEIKEKTVFEEISNIEEFNIQGDFVEDLIKQDKNNFIKKKILELKKPYNEILTQYYIKGYTLDEISKIHNTTKGTIKVQLTRGKKIFKDILERSGFYE